MSRLDPLSRDDLPEFRERFDFMETAMGFVPNSMLTMARVPDLVTAFENMGRAVMGSGLIPAELAQLVALLSSVGSGCRYCQAHTGHRAESLGVSEDKLAAVWDFENSELFTDAERAALRLAFRAGQVPNAVSDDDFDACREHFDDDQITAIVAVCSLFGFLNRWNDTMATQLESAPIDFGRRVLGPGGWQADKHGA